MSSQFLTNEAIKLTGSTKNKKRKDFKYLLTNQNSKPLAIEDIINITLVLIKVQKNVHSVQPKYRIFVKGYGFFTFGKNMGKSIGKDITKNLTGKYG